MSILRHSRPGGFADAVPLILRSCNVRPLSLAAKAGSRGGKTPQIEYNPRPYRDLDLPSLMNSYLVYKLCRSEKLVENASAILERMQSLGLSMLTNKFIKVTFFKHFCGGETPEELESVQTTLKNRNICSILDYACEAEYDEDKPLKLEDAVNSARDFAGKIAATVDWCVHGLKPVVVMKVTSLLSPKVLIGWSNTLNLFQSEFEELAKGPKAVNGKIDFDTFCMLSDTFARFKTDKELVMKAFEAADTDKDKLVDYVDMIPVFSLHNPEFMGLLVGCTPKDPTKYISCFVDDLQVEITKRSLPFTDALLKKIMDRKLRGAIDAEQTYFHPAIDDFALGFARKYVYSDKAAVYNTYQMYLKNTEKKMKEHYESAKRLGVPFAFKIVRGAYIQTERERAQRYGYEDPVQPTYEDTCSNYDKNVSFFIDEVAKMSKKTPVGLLIATHNEDSVSQALAHLSRLNMPSCDISFAQLYGMKDPLTKYLASTPYTVYKYIPHGPVEITIPYLIRRAIENKGVITGSPAKKGRSAPKPEEDLIFDEIFSRFPMGTQATKS